MFSLFKLSPRKMRDQQLQDAQCSLVQHKQAAAYHAAMSTYLAGEIGRLSAEVAAEGADRKVPFRTGLSSASPMAVYK